MKTVFGLFLDFGGSDRLDIAYDDSPKCFSTYGSGLRSCTINQVCIMCINCAKRAKISFFVLDSVARIDSVSHMMEVLNISLNLAVAIAHAQLKRYA